MYTCRCIGPHGSRILVVRITYRVMKESVREAEQTVIDLWFFWLIILAIQNERLLGAC